MKFSARIARDILKAESATIVLEAVDEADATRLAMLAAEEDDPEICWNDDNIDEVQDAEVLWVDEIPDDDAAEPPA
jgi:hypothetical protein